MWIANSDVLLIFVGVFFSNLYFSFSSSWSSSLYLFIHFSSPIFRERTNVDLHTGFSQPIAHLLFEKKSVDKKIHENRLSQSLFNMNNAREKRRCSGWILLFSAAEKRIYSNNNRHNNTTSWNQNRKMGTHTHTHVKLILMSLW